MSTTRITIVKIAGHLGEAISRLFQRWVELANCDKLSEGPLFNGQVQNKLIAESWLSLSQALEDHCDHPSIIWFQRFVDTWTIAPCLHAVDDCEALSNHVKLIRSDFIDILLLTGSDREVARHLKERIAKSFNQKNYSIERRYFLNQLRHCAISWQPFLETKNIDTVKLVVFHAIGPSRLDCDVVRMAKNIPEWFQHAKFL